MLQSLKRHPLRVRICVFGVVLFAVAGYLILRTPVRMQAPSVIEYPLRGADLSAHNSVTDWNTLAAAVDFVLLKATEGGNWNDRKFRTNYENARAAGLKVGAYHFFRFDRESLPQAINFFNAIWGKRLDFPAVIDVEEDGNPEGVDRDKVVERIGQMVEFLESHGVRVMFYANKKSYSKYLEHRFSEYPVWICSLSSEPDDNMNWIIWQFSHTGNLPGIKGEVDLNVFRNKKFDDEQIFVK